MPERADDPGCIFDVCRYYDTETGEWGYERACVASAEHDCEDNGDVTVTDLWSADPRGGLV